MSLQRHRNFAGQFEKSGQIVVLVLFHTHRDTRVRSMPVGRAPRTCREGAIATQTFSQWKLSLLLAVHCAPAHLWPCASHLAFLSLSSLYCALACSLSQKHLRRSRRRAASPTDRPEATPAATPTAKASNPPITGRHAHASSGAAAPRPRCEPRRVPRHLRLCGGNVVLRQRGSTRAAGLSWQAAAKLAPRLVAAFAASVRTARTRGAGAAILPAVLALLSRLDDLIELFPILLHLRTQPTGGEPAAVTHVCACVLVDASSDASPVPRPTDSWLTRARRAAHPLLIVIREALCVHTALGSDGQLRVCRTSTGAKPRVSTCGIGGGGVAV